MSALGAGGRIQVPGTYGLHQTKKKFLDKKKFLVYQQGLQGAEFMSLGHMECIRRKKNFLVHQQVFRTIVPKTAQNQPFLDTKLAIKRARRLEMAPNL